MQAHAKRSLGLILLIVMLTVLRVQAQQVSNKRITFDNFSFTLDPALATNVNVVQFPGDPIDEVYPGGPQPPHTRFLLYAEPPAPEVVLQAHAMITMYPLTDMDGYEAHTRFVETLRDLLAERPDLSDFEQTRDSLSEITLPFLPIMPGAQVIRARAKYVQTDTFDGIAFVTVYRQDVAPFLAYEFIYTFQGLSANGGTYVTVVMPVQAAMFPDELPSDYNPEAFIATMNDYFAESIELLNTGDPHDFVPDLPLAMSLVESINIETDG